MYMCVYIYIYVYIYIEREMYIYIYIERERDTHLTGVFGILEVTCVLAWQRHVVFAHRPVGSTFAQGGLPRWPRPPRCESRTSGVIISIPTIINVYSLIDDSSTPVYNATLGRLLLGLHCLCGRPPSLLGPCVRPISLLTLSLLTLSLLTLLDSNFPGNPL